MSFFSGLGKLHDTVTSGVEKVVGGAAKEIKGGSGLLRFPCPLVLDC